MYRVFQNVVLFAVSLHMVLGCCVHHAHSRPLASGDEPICESTCPHHHGHDEESRDPCDHRSGGHGCEHGRCVFTRAESDGAPQFLVRAHCLPVLGLVPCQPTLNGVEAVDLAIHSRCQPIPLHLLNQALLL